MELSAKATGCLTQADTWLARLRSLIDRDLADFNEAIRAADVPAIVTKQAEKQPA